MDRAEVTESGSDLAVRVTRLRHATRLHIVLDYDGTLVPFAPISDLADPDTELLELLAQLSWRQHIRLHLVSGRTRPFMEAWFGHLPIALHAEDGYWSRRAPGEAWIAGRLGPLGWKHPVGEVLMDLTRRTDGSFFERKTVSLAWHYRMTDPLLARERLAEARSRLERLACQNEFELLDRPMVLEVRKRGVEKGRVVSALGPLVGTVLAAGDDLGDEPLFGALPPNAVAIHVGRGVTCAQYSVASPDALRRTLRMLLPEDSAASS